MTTSAGTVEIQKVSCKFKMIFLLNDIKRLIIGQIRSIEMMLVQPQLPCQYNIFATSTENVLADARPESRATVGKTLFTSAETSDQ